MHWQCLSVTHSFTDSCLVNLIDVTLACEDAYSKLVEVVTVANDSDEDRTPSPESAQPQKLCTANFSSGTIKTLIN